MNIELMDLYIRVLKWNWTIDYVAEQIISRNHCRVGYRLIEGKWTCIRNSCLVMEKA